MNYYRSQVGRLGPSEVYRLKITADQGETKWLDVTPDQLRRITDVLAEGDDSPGQTEPA